MVVQFPTCNAPWYRRSRGIRSAAAPLVSPLSDSTPAPRSLAQAGRRAWLRACHGDHKVQRKLEDWMVLPCFIHVLRLQTMILWDIFLGQSVFQFLRAHVLVSDEF